MVSDRCGDPACIVGPPLDDAQSAGYVVEMRREVDGVVRRTQHREHWGDVSLFQWTEGNYACDCNRNTFFDLAGGMSAATIHPCGETAFTAVKAILPDGSEIALDHR
jgi:hypothetical protein